MSQEFTRPFRVRWSETNALGHVDLAGYLRYVMETAWDWGAAGGLSIADSEALGVVWVIRETEINLFRPLQANDTFALAIWLDKWRRVRGTRCFELRLEDKGDLVAQGVQQVATLDDNTLRPVRLPEPLLANFLTENPRTILQQKFPKFPPLRETAFASQREVTWRDLDSLAHVNNATYASFAEDAAVHALAVVGWSPARFQMEGTAVVNRRFHILYQAPAIWGERLQVALYLASLTPTGGTWHLEMKREADNTPIVQCVLEWSLVDRENGVAKTLPESLFQALQEKTALSEDDGTGS